MFDDVSREKDYEKRVIYRLRKHGYASHIEASIPGFPDIIFISGNKILFIEMKKRRYNTDTADSLLRPVQKAYHEMLNKYGTNVYTVLADSKGYDLYKNNVFLLSGTVDEVVEKMLYEESF